ncbi:uncharacterized protein LOC142985945 [Anticarsia gemmatalis]|uniref:uncharacterized protein LOC142985945 n=1 Tax=Anticarsia gemmatalis TaxID=129554 RepID=UPI003F760DED
MILSVQVYELIVLPGLICKGSNQPIAQKTKLGWILSRTVQPQSYCNVVNVDLGDIQKFWEIEDVAINDHEMSSEDYECIQQYQLSTKRQPDGRYVVTLPLKPELTEKLGESKTKAVAQLHQLEKRFSRNLTIANSYKEFIHEYAQSNHMSECTGNQTPACYLPHHCVLRAESKTSATRVVFNASAKISTGYSLNDLMFSGPNLQKDLFSLIVSWRQYHVAFTADIEKMFRQILIQEEHQALQKIVWRDHKRQPLQEYQLATVTYGTKAAPFLAMMTLKQLAKDEGHRFPKAAEVVETSFYMDDLLHGHHNLESAKQLKYELTALLRSGGFKLRKWSSNKPELLDHEDSGDLSNKTYSFKHQESTKVLGLQWQPQEDLFTFDFKVEAPSKLTKRTLLSSISQIFDPLGWLSPVTTKLKLLFQETWSLNFQWHEILPDHITQKWYTIQDDIDNINHTKVERWLQCNKGDTIELHGFCDASEKAYASVVYCRRPQQNLESGDIVIVHDANLPPGKWALGRVVKLHPGKDGFVRVVSAKLEESFSKRMAELEAQLQTGAAKDKVAKVAEEFRTFRELMFGVLGLLRQQISECARMVDSIETRHRRKDLLFLGIPESAKVDQQYIVSRCP